MMIETIFTLIFVMAGVFISFRAKNILYVDEHILSIQNELNTFDENIKKIKGIEDDSDFKLGSGHIYE